MVKINQPFLVADNIEWTETNGEIVLIELSTERFFAFDEIGVLIWTCAMSGALLSEIVDKVSERFYGDPEKIRDEITFFLNSLIDQGWLIQEELVAIS